MIAPSPSHVVCALGDASAPLGLRVKDPAMPAGWSPVAELLPDGWIDLGGGQHLCSNQDAAHLARAQGAKVANAT